MVPNLNILNVYKKYESEGRIKNKKLTIVDYTMPSTSKRMSIYDMKSGKPRLLGTYLVAHGKNSGGVIPHSFSNKIGSLQSSLGAILTLDTYIGKYGRSLKLQGLEKGVNDNMGIRAVVVHGSKYVSDAYIKENGAIGRSWGCLALDFAVKDEVIDLIKNGSLIYSIGN